MIERTVKVELTTSELNHFIKERALEIQMLAEELQHDGLSEDLLKIIADEVQSYPEFLTLLHDMNQAQVTLLKLFQARTSLNSLSPPKIPE